MCVYMCVFMCVFVCVCVRVCSNSTRVCVCVCVPVCARENNACKWKAKASDTNACHDVKLDEVRWLLNKYQ